MAVQILRENLVFLFSKYLKETMNGVLTGGKESQKFTIKNCVINKAFRERIMRNNISVC